MTLANNPNTLKSQIESLWNSGMKPARIAEKLNATPLYVDQVIYCASRRPTPDTAFRGDDDKHLQLIYTSNAGHGFPYCQTPAQTLRRAS